MSHLKGSKHYPVYAVLRVNGNFSTKSEIITDRLPYLLITHRIRCHMWYKCVSLDQNTRIHQLGTLCHHNHDSCELKYKEMGGR